MLPSIRTVPVSSHLNKNSVFEALFSVFSVNEVFRMKAEHFSFKIKVLASLKLRNSRRRRRSVQKVLISRCLLRSKISAAQKRVGNM